MSTFKPIMNKFAISYKKRSFKRLHYIDKCLIDVVYSPDKVTLFWGKPLGVYNTRLTHSLELNQDDKLWLMFNSSDQVTKEMAYEIMLTKRRSMII